MKKLSLILASALLLGGISFASPVVKQQTAASSSKQVAKPAAKKAPVKGAKKASTAKKSASAPAK